MKVYAVYDSKAEAYLTPMFFPNNAVAIRSFAQAANNEETDFHRHAGDYTLTGIGEWDEQTGTIAGCKTKTNLGTALEMITTGES